MDILNFIQTEEDYNKDLELIEKNNKPIQKSRLVKTTYYRYMEFLYEEIILKCGIHYKKVLTRLKEIEKSKLLKEYDKDTLYEILINEIASNYLSFCRIIHSENLNIEMFTPKFLLSNEKEPKAKAKFLKPFFTELNDYIFANPYYNEIYKKG